ncbi:histidine phosphatase family protein [Bacillus sp. SM2101]|uniref:histidine phosphatase family protein n=1 Tax=Bacillus sp. SM2101 TaxID=2805366 RepID=UPI001BDF2AEF|nr:histidine phosphatase family protein [Bacillus sp. SM2101]
MKTNLFFVRHAHATYTPDELGRPLSKQGLYDATQVTSILKDEKIDIVISSPFKRAIQTVDGIAQHRDMEIVLKDDFRERLLSDGPVENFLQAITAVWENEQLSFKGGESNIIAQARGVKVTKEILSKYEGKNIVVGTHGNIMVLIMNYFDPQFDFAFWKQLTMPDIYKLSFDGHELVDVYRLWSSQNH